VPPQPQAETARISELPQNQEEIDHLAALNSGWADDSSDEDNAEGDM
jgi:hypothetical protein